MNRTCDSMHTVYFYPKINFRASQSPNPYISDFEAALSKHYKIANKSYNKKGVLNFFRYLFRTDIYFFNWIEDLVSYRYGKLQIIVFCFFVFCCKLLGKKIIWILHNKYSHDRNRNKWTDFTFMLMIKHADLILTHSLSGISFVETQSPLDSKKVRYFVHPVNQIFPIVPNQNEVKFDFLIWGSIFPYKGILEFLKFINANKANFYIKILIVGKCMDHSYNEELQKCLSANITHYNDVFDIENIARFAHQSRFVLFTYKSVSVLSSGALMDSIRMRSVIIGPNHGAFKDLSGYRFIKTYDTYEDIFTIWSNYEPNVDQLNFEIEAFCKTNSWPIFIKKVQREVDHVL